MLIVEGRLATCRLLPQLVEPPDLLSRIARLGIVRIDPEPPELLLETQLIDALAARRRAAPNERQFPLAQCDLVAAALDTLKQVRAVLLAVKLLIGFAGTVDDTPELLLGLALGQRLRRDQRAQRLLDLHDLLGALGRERAQRDRVVQPTLAVDLTTEFRHLPGGFDRLFSDPFPQGLSRAGFRVDAFMGLIDEPLPTSLRACGGFSAFEIGLGQRKRRADRDLRGGGLLHHGLRRRIDRGSVAGQFRDDTPVGRFDLRHIGQLRANERIGERGAEHAFLRPQPLDLACAGVGVAGDLAGAHRLFVGAGLRCDPPRALLLVVELPFEFGDPPLDLRQHERHDIAAHVRPEPLLLPAQQLQLLRRRAAIHRPVDGLAERVEGVRGRAPDEVPGPPERIDRLFGVGQRGRERVQDDALRFRPIVLVDQRTDIGAGAVVQEADAVVEFVRAAQRIGQRAGQFLRALLRVDAKRDAKIARDRDGAAHFLRADLAGAKKRDLHVARRRHRDPAGIGGGLRDLFQLRGGRAGRAADARERGGDRPRRGVIGEPRCREHANRDRDARDDATDNADGGAERHDRAAQAAEGLRHLSTLLHQDGHRRHAGGHRRDHVVHRVLKRHDLLGRELRVGANAFDRLRGLIEPRLRQRIRRRLLGGGDRATAGERGMLGQFGVEAILRGGERIKRRAQSPGAGLVAFRLPRGLFEDLGRRARRTRRLSVDAQNLIEPPLRRIGLRRHAGGFRQTLEPGGFPIGRGSGLLKRPINLPEGLRSGLTDLLEGTLDLRLAFDAKADRDIGGGHGRRCSIAIGTAGVAAIGGHDDRLDLGKDVGQQRRGRFHGRSQGEHRAEVDGVDAAHHGANLSSAAANDLPCEKPLGRHGRVLDIGASPAPGWAGGAVAIAALEVPAREGDQTFFSSNLVKAGPT